MVIGQERTESEHQVLNEEKLDEISARLEHSSQKSLDTLHRRSGFKVSSFKFALLQIKSSECEHFTEAQGMHT
jgi:hypothetical protein